MNECMYALLTRPAKKVPSFRRGAKSASGATRRLDSQAPELPFRFYSSAVLPVAALLVPQMHSAKSCEAECAAARPQGPTTTGKS